MSKNNNNDIEGVFRNAAAKHPAGFDNQHWQALKEKLDEQTRAAGAVRTNKLKKVALALLLIVLLSGGAYWINSENVALKEHHKYSQDVTSKTPMTTTTQELDVEPEPPIIVAEQRQDSPPAEAASDRDLGRNDKMNEMSSEEVRQGNNEVALPLNQGTLRSDDIKGGDTAKEAGQNSKVAPGRHLAQTEADKRNEPVTVAEDVRPNAQEIEAPGQSIAAVTTAEENAPDGSQKDIIATLQKSEGHRNVAETRKEAVEIDSLSSESESSIIEKKRDRVVERPLFGLSLTLGPDLSVLGLGEITRPGYSYGIMLHYNLHERWSVGIGALKTTKRYVGTGHDYNPPKGYWEYATDNVIPQKVTGECALIEVPIDIRYNFLISERSKFHLSGGVSSYFMQGESYEYTFEKPNPCASQGWASTKAEGRHLFNIVNLSVGYERDISRSFSLGISPYVKVPVEGIGWSEVKFVSFGSYFTFKYNLLTRKPSGL